MAKATGVYRYDPATSTAYLLTDPTGIYPVNPEYLFSGNYYAEGYTLREVGTNRIYDSLGRSGEIGIITYDNGVTLVTSGVVRDSLTSSEARGGAYAISGTAAVMLPDGTVQTIDISRSIVTGPNEVLYRIQDANGIEHFRHGQPGSAQYNSDQQRYPNSFRLATTNEAVEYAIRGYILTNYKDLIEQAAGQMASELGGTADDWFSAAFDQLYQRGSEVLSYSKETYVNESGNPFKTAGMTG